MKKRRQYTSEFKVKVILEVLREEQTLGEIASKHEINPNQLATWKREFLEKAPKVFEESKNDREQRRIEREAAEKETRMLKTIGQLTMERDFLQAIRAKETERGTL
ncbi:MAG: transposase [Peptococcaceae bacterium]|nr:transposase [Peptococcaceae bacterium]